MILLFSVIVLDAHSIIKQTKHKYAFCGLSRDKSCMAEFLHAVLILKQNKKYPHITEIIV